MKPFLEAIGRTDLLSLLTADRTAWQILIARKPYEKAGAGRRSIASFHSELWDRELGKGGLIGDLTDQDRSTIEVIPSGAMSPFRSPVGE